MQGSATSLRRRKAEEVTKSQPNTHEPTETTTRLSEIDTLSYYLFQYGGLVLGATSCVGTVACYRQDDPYMLAKMLGWLSLALFGLLLHEFRPFQRPTQ
ncbi:hypothetical protein Ndes2526A_g02299 [Nannochloris sp. 'desiccata']